MSISFLLSDSVVVSLKAAELAKSDASQKGVVGLIALAADVSDSRFPHGAAVKLGESLKNQAGFKASVAKFYSEKAATIVDYAHNQALLAVKGMPKSDEKAAAYRDAVLATISGLGTLKSVAQVMAKVRPPKDTAAVVEQAAKVEPAAVVDLTKVAPFFDLLAMFAAGVHAANVAQAMAAKKPAAKKPAAKKEKIAA